ncbi:UDP-glucose 4 epimerase [Moumouvirus australiensis]|uniref:UDP-glucose 4 epimerase n=1 Tax=Moumouvirus australiensis TaxID=2109587 RepID=A0A2P1ELU0_9VIRU|nr:UDP-glucose 4 epimerase [Moumouvirus australiensis]AVL94853.1 UDP-glucose 4 epimerase [Moumouvirus australiensis]
MNILVTGITGFFGRNFTSYLKNKVECTIIGTAHSECKLAYFKKSFPDVKTYIVELSSERFESEIEYIIKAHNINYIIHSAAMKHVDICQDNSTMALRVNSIASDTLIKVAKRNNVVNVIALSTDKSNNPCNTYGFVKYIMQENVLSNGYSVYQGANFFWSDGSVLDIWFNQFIKNKPLTIRNKNHVRYFNTIDYVCERIFQNIDNKGSIILPDHVYVVKLEDLFEAFKEYFKYDKSETIGQYDYEKNIEILKDEIKNKIYLNKEELIPLIDKFYKNML